MFQLLFNKGYLCFLVLSVPIALYLGVTNNNGFMEGYDKLVHFSVFMIETFLFNKSIKSFRFTNYTVDLNRHHLNFFVCFMVGCVGSEYFQHFVNPNRAFDLNDIMANLLGSTLGYALTFISK